MNAPLPLASSSNGRVSGKSWKPLKTAAVRSHLPEGVKTKSWEDRMKKNQKALAIKKLETELKEEKQAELQRCAPSQPLCVVANTPVDAGRSLWSVSSMPKKNVAWRRQKPRCAPHTVPVRLSHSSIRLDGRAQSCPPAPQGRPYKED